MKKILTTIKIHLIRAIIFCFLFVILFFLGYWIVNINIDAPYKTTDLAADVSVSKGSEDFRKNLGSLAVSDLKFEKWAAINGIEEKNLYQSDSDKDGLLDYREYIHATNPNQADTDKDGFSDLQELKNGYDPDDDGKSMLIVSVKIEKLKIETPMVWSKTDVEKDMLLDLEKGISHFAGTASPGQNGNMIVSGHSSNYIWAKGDYNDVFKDLNNLEKGDLITMDVIQKNGKVITYKYSVSDKYITDPEDERIFMQTQNPTLTLATCWPLGTSLKRVIVKTEMVQ